MINSIFLRLHKKISNMYRKINSLFIRLKNFIRIHFSRSYTASLEGAYDFTVRNFGHQFKLPDVRFPVDKDTLNANDLPEVFSCIVDYIEEQGESNIAFRCNIVCMEIHDRLKSQYNIDSIVTSGDCRLNGNKIWSATRRQLLAQFGHRVPTMSHHVWLTIGEYIIDPTIMTTIRQKKRELFSNNIYEVTHMIFLCKHKHKTMRLENVILEYKPRLVGCEFYEHTQYGIPVFSISSGGPIK